MHVIAALYHFTSFKDPAALRPRLLEVCEREGIRGTLLLAPEGINGTISGTRAGIDAALAAIIALPGCNSLEWKESFASAPPFKKLKIRLKREIVTMGQPQVKPRERTGHYVDPSEWNALIAAPGVVTIDTRNDFEVAIGSFEGAVDPQTTDFRDFPGWWQENKARFEGKRIAMFCTGGIRCEKSTNYLLGEGVEEVFHLKGGILKYLETVPEDQSTWHGECFVFDKRVSVGHGLKEGEHILCHACRRAIRPEDTARAEYEEGVRCHLCIDEYAEADRARFRERMKQRRIGGHD